MRIEQACAHFLPVMLLLAACGNASEGVSGERLASNREAIIKGNPVFPDTIGTPLVNAPNGSCTGTLLSGNWLLTANHCVTIEQAVVGGTPWDPSSINVTLLTAGVPFGTVGTSLFQHPTLDVAVVRLRDTVFNPSGVPFANPLYLGSGSSLLGTSVFCQGWGEIDVSGTDGGLNSASLPVASGNSTSIRVAINSAGQNLSHGDSGGACFTTIDQTLRIVGVGSTLSKGSNGQINGAFLASVEGFRDWVGAVVGNSIAIFSDPNFRGWSQSIIPYDSPNSLYDVSQLIVGNDSISSLIVPPNWRLWLYRDAGFANLLGSFSGQMLPSLPAGINDQTSSVATVLGMGAQAFADPNLNTLVAQLVPGRNVLSDADNQISSLSVPAGWRVTLFDNPDFTGASMSYQEGSFATVGQFMDNIASSAIVERPVEVFMDSNFRSAVGKLLPGCYRAGQLGVPNDSISSILIPPGMRVRAFRDDGTGGTPTVFSTSQASLPNLNDAISTICVDRQ